MKYREIYKNLKFAIKYIYDISPTYIVLVILSAILTSIYKIGLVYFINILTEMIVLNKKDGFIEFSVMFFAIYIFALLVNSLTQNYYLPIIDNKIALKVQNDIYNAHILKKLH